MEQSTLIGKLKDLNFYVYLYQLETPRIYEGNCNPNTIGLGYVGKEGSSDIEVGINKILSKSTWVRDNINYLKEKHGKDFPNKTQYEVFNQLDKEFSLLISNEMMSEIKARAWIELHMLRYNQSIEERIQTLQELPVKVEYRRINESHN